MSAMPDWVPVFRARDMTRGVAVDGDRRCALGWQRHLGISRFVFDAAYCDANRCLSPVTGNDYKCRTNQERADAMNRAMRWLGYTEVEDWDD